MKRIIVCLVLLLAISLAFCDLRLVGTSITFLQGDLGKGYPRLAEVLAILASVVFFLISFTKKTCSEKIRIGRDLFLLCGLIMFGFALFKPFFLNYLRSVCLIPTLFFISVINLDISDKLLGLLFKIIYSIISISAIFVIISPFIDLGVSTFYIDEFDSTAQRYIGYGSSLPYQACFNLLAIPLFFYLQRKDKSKLWNYLQISMLVLNVAAIVLTGARTAYLIAIVLFLFYSKSWRKNLNINSAILIVLIAGVAIYYVGDILSSILNYRHGVDLSHRDEVWLIGIKLVLTNPILGIQNFFEDGKQFGQIVAHVQCGYFEILFWGGFLALTLYLSSFAMFYSVLKPHKDLKVCFIGTMLVFLIFMITEILIYSVQDYYLLLLIIGLLLANYQTKMRHYTLALKTYEEYYICRRAWKPNV